VIVREAGGRATSIDGTDGPVGPGLLCTNGLLHDEVLDLLAEFAEDAAEKDETEESVIIVGRRGLPPEDH
jgi:histidinol-phosphatase